MILQADTTYYHQGGLVRLFLKGEEAPGDGWGTQPFPGVALRTEERSAPAVAPRSPFDHDGDGKPGGSLPGPRKRGRPRKAG